MKNKRILFFLIIVFSYFPVNGQVTKIYKSFDFLEFKPLNDQRGLIDSVEVVTDSFTNQIMKLRLLKGLHKNFEILVNYEDEYIVLNFNRIHGSDAEDCDLPRITILPSTYIYSVASSFCDGWYADKTMNIFKLDNQLMIKNEFIFCYDSDNRFRRLLAVNKISIYRKTSFTSFENEVSFSKEIAVPLNYSKPKSDNFVYNENIEDLYMVLECHRIFLDLYDTDKFYDLGTTKHRGSIEEAYYWWEVF